MRIVDRISLLFDSPVNLLSILDFLENVCYFVLLGLVIWALLEILKVALDLSSRL